MKIRAGFVSNSSSSSFVVSLSVLTAEQVEQIVDHISAAKSLDAEGYGFVGEYATTEGDEWETRVTGETVEGWTPMDNFDMLRFIEDIGVKAEHIKSESGHFYQAPWEKKNED